ncbi:MULTISPECIES: hypothetical protein [unclassified Anabaena]|uniref:hypothetical protein n=1 Tax=unclassified Anabaena TaxID=2619674 RepID=UPI0039C7038E
MTKYDKIFNSSQVSKETLSPEEAVAAIATITAIAHASVDEVDVENLVSILWEFEVFEEYSADEIVEIVDKLIGIAEDEGLGSLFNLANESLSDDLVLDAFAAGVIVVIDEEELVIPKQKQPYLKKLQEALELEDEETQEIIQEVIAALEEAENEEYFDDDDTVVKDYGDDVYESPSGNFSVPIPVDPQQGGKVNSQEGLAAFSDDFGTFLRIDYYSIPSDQLEELESIGQEEYLQSLLVNKYLPQAIFSNVPKAEVKYTEYLADKIEGSYFVLVHMPQGSTISQQENNGTATKLDAYRGLLAFMNTNYVYIVSSQHNFFNGEMPTSIAEEAKDIQENILDFVETIEFS